MHRALSLVTVALSLAVTSALGQSASGPVELGKLTTGGVVKFQPVSASSWGIEVANAESSHLLQQKPVRLEFFHTEEDIRQTEIGYSSVTKEGGSVVARADAPYGSNVILHIEDRWSLQGATLSVHRIVRVAGDSAGGFSTGLMLTSAPSVTFAGVDYLVPAALYGGPGQNNEGGPAGANAFAAKHFELREDALPAPMLGLSFKDGSTVTVLDTAPHGETTEEDTRARVATVLIDNRFRFGAFGAHEASGGGVEFGYWYPGGVTAPARASAPGRPTGTDFLRRYHAMKDGFVQDYQLSYRFGEAEPLPLLTKNAWRWAWQTLNPQVTKLDVEIVRHTLYDHLADRVFTIDGRSGIPWIFQVTTGDTWHRPDDMRTAMGFVGKNIEAADEMLMEADRDSTARGQRLRKLALAIIHSYITLVPMTPPAGEGFDLTTGEPTVSFPASSWRGNLKAGQLMFIRAPSEDMRRLMEAYVREKMAGRDHPEWLQWCREFADWLVPQQRPDGSFPRAWRPGTTTVVEQSSTASYAPVPLLILLSKQTGSEGAKYMDAATKASEFIWSSQGEKGVFTGATMDHPDVIDKEAGMLSLEAFLGMYETTKDTKWLTRAKVAADFAESWMYLWNVPMPADANDAELHWKKGVPTTGVGVIGIGGNGGCDEFLDWSAPSFARLYKYTNDSHYRDVARILLLDTKAMLALPGRTFDMAGPGWQQENFNLSSHRGFGGHRGWLPWVSVNHLWSIVGLEAFDPVLFKQLSSGAEPAISPSSAQ